MSDKGIHMSIRGCDASELEGCKFYQVRIGPKNKIHVCTTAFIEGGIDEVKEQFRKYIVDNLDEFITISAEEIANPFEE